MRSTRTGASLSTMATHVRARRHARAHTHLGVAQLRRQAAAQHVLVIHVDAGALGQVDVLAQILPQPTARRRRHLAAPSGAHAGLRRLRGHLASGGERSEGADRTRNAAGAGYLYMY